MSDQNTSSIAAASVGNSADSGAVMSTAETLGNIFFDPGSTFESLRIKPKFLVAGVLTIIFTTAVVAMFFNKINFAEFMREQIENGPNSAQMSDDQKAKAVQLWAGPIGKSVIYVSPVIGSVVVFAAGAGLYLLAVLAMGGSMNYKQALSVWIYSSFPPVVLGSLIGMVVLLIKSADSIDPKHPESIAQTNLGILLDPASSPVLYALLSSIDLFQIFGLVLAAIGLRKIAKLSSGTAWTVVLGLFLIRVLGRVGWAAITGR
jgi:Yip1 domain